MDKNKKPKLKIAEQITHLSDKGVKFERMSKISATEYLLKNSNYFKLTAYRKTYEKHLAGEREGQYIDLDFAQLKDLSIIDMRIRYTLIHLALDVEHYAKVRLIKRIEESDDDGYEIVKKYVDSLSEVQQELFKKEIQRNRNNPYCGAIIEKYDDQFPVWVFVEIIPFGRYVSFCKFCAQYYNDKKMMDNYYRLLMCKEIRNASAHSNCIINDLTPNTTKHKTNDDVSRELMKISGITKDIRVRKMSNARIQQIITLLYTHKALVGSSGVQKHESEVLHQLIERMFHHIDYYAGNDTISTTFNFLKLVIDNWYKIEYNSIT